MKSAYLLFTLFLLSLSIISPAQQFYVCDNTLNLYEVTTNAGTGCTYNPIARCAGFTPFSIAMYKDTLYSIEGPYLRRSKIVNGAASNCATVCPIPTTFQALTVDSSGILYASSGTLLYKIDPHSGISTQLGVMPYTTGGDLIFYRGDLYLAANFPVRGIVKVNIANPAQSSMYIPIPNSDILGMVTISANCTSNKVFAMNRVGLTTQLLELDMAQQSVVGVQCTLNIQVYDAASIVETGQYAGVNVQSILSKPECTNSPASGSLQIHTAFSNNTFTLNNTTTNTTGIFNGLTPGNYAIHISTVNGCVLDTFATVGLADTPQVQVTTSPAFCSSNNGSIVSSAISTPPYVYSLNGGSTQLSGTFNNLGAGNYLLQARDGHSCTSSYQVVIHQQTPSLTQNITITPAICAANNGTIIVSATGASGYSINNGIQQSTGQFANLAPGNYTVSTFTSQGCRYDSLVTINNVYPIVVPSITIRAAACNQNNGTITVNANGATGYSINNGTQQTNGLFLGLAPGNYTVSVFTSSGCRYDSLVSVTHNNFTIEQTVTLQPAACNVSNGAITVSSSTATAYSINNGTQQSNGHFPNLAPGTYQLTSFNTQGCRKDTTVIITNIIHPSPTIQISATVPDCYDRNNGSITLSINGPHAPYLSSLGGSTFTNQHAFLNLNSGTVALQIKGADGCITDTVTVVPAYVLSKPTFTVSKVNPLCTQPQKGTIQVNLAGTGTPYQIIYKNNMYPAQYLFNNLTEGRYFFKIHDRYGCAVDSSTVALQLIQTSECDTIYLPTAFTPNSDGKNDIFKAIAFGSPSHFRLSVYNRFGQEMFTTTDIHKGWDGKLKSFMQPLGAYVWKMTYQLGNRPEKHLQGTVMLIH